MGLLRGTPGTCDLQSRAPRRRGRGIRFALELGRPRTPRRSRSLASLSRTCCRIDMSTARGRLERLLGGPALGDLRERLRRRYELGRINDAFTLAAISVNERSALEGLLGRRARSSSSMQISVTE